MSGYQLTKQSGSMSVHTKPVDASKVFKAPSMEDETELIQSVSLSELEKKIRALIEKNAEIFPASSMVHTLHKARELEGNLAELIRATFRQVNEVPAIFRTGTSSTNSSCEKLIMELITENVGLLLSLGKDTSDETLTVALNKCRSKVKSLVSENVEQLLLRLKDVEDTLKDYRERVTKAKALRLCEVKPISSEQELSKPKIETKEVELENKSEQPHHQINTGLNVTAFKVPHLRPMSGHPNAEHNNLNERRRQRKLLLKCFKNDGASGGKYRAYVYKMPSFKRATNSMKGKRNPGNNQKRNSVKVEANTLVED